MRVLLVQPPPGGRSVRLPPLGLAYLAAVIRRAGHQVALLDAAALGLDLARTQRFAARYQPDLIGLTGSSPTAAALVAAARGLRRHARWLIAGGPHATAAPEALLAAAPELDLVLRGEAEVVIAPLLDRLAQGFRPQDWLGVCVPGRIQPTAAPVEDLDCLPWPARDLLPRGIYRHPLAAGRPLTTLLSSRGCAEHCTFCDRSVSGHRWRARSADSVIDELLALATEGYREVGVYDDDFLHDPDRAAVICAGLLRAGTPVGFTCEARPVARDPELYRLLARAGCRRIAFGVDAGTPEGLRELGKRIDLDQAQAAFRQAQEAGLETLGYFILGLQAEPPGHDAALSLALQIDPDHAQFSALSPYPGSALYHSARRRGLLTEDARARGPADLGHTRAFVDQGGWSGPLLGQQVLRSYRRFYLRPVKLGRQLARIRSRTELLGLMQAAAELFGALWTRGAK